jgi:hypothetical protein
MEDLCLTPLLPSRSERAENEAGSFYRRSVLRSLLPLPSKSFTKKWLDFRGVVPSTLPDGGVVLYAGVSAADWSKFVTAVGSQEKPALALRYLRYDETTQCIWIVELPTRAHDRVNMWIDRRFAMQGHDNFLYGDATATSTVIGKQPDGQWTPIGLPVSDACDDEGNPFPTVVLEVGYSQPRGGERGVLRDIERWFTPPSTVQVVLAVMINNKRVAHPLPNPAVQLILEVYYRENFQNGQLGDPHRRVSFGNYGTYVETPLQEYMVSIPGHLIYAGHPVLHEDPLPPRVTSGMTLDLYLLQQWIFDSVRRMM